ncbi:methyltransferase domain-containing protein [Streptomyces hiroshimensis]|uniref:Protein-L-isoaspartate O-methyltransferase n=1 Tax=Streptomyces hiroshimensis TaxID=66424 RepID=A0ABQ2YB70_9ACTN|nr:methyltransferase domain-containing protein [Streptomyces hiroshimensis]GGX77937.1 protein-L-isoaspartate O-methyltransferase [Streptomyces hiroshimensis]
MTPPTAQAVDSGRDGLRRLLLDTGALEPAWVPAFDAVRRAGFLPDVMWPHDMGTGRSRTVDKAHDPDTWQRYADSDCPIVTQWDDGAHKGPEPGRSFSSSSSMPSLVFSMLADLDVGEGHHVLEIGTGTGWNAGLLAHRVGPAGSVVTVDVDRAVASAGREALWRAGLTARVLHRDGFLGFPERAPYDRVIATCGLRTIPFAWVEQTAPGGVILVPWGTYYGPEEATARLVVAEDGRSASGPFTQPVGFMRMRSQRLVRRQHAAYVPPGAMDRADVSVTTLRAADAAGFVMGLLVHDATHVADRERDGRRAVWLYGLSDTSWAVADFRDGRDEAKVYQSGPRRLWDEAEAAHQWWEAEGRPGFERFGLTVMEGGRTALWLDDPAGVL